MNKHSAHWRKVVNPITNKKLVRPLSKKECDWEEEARYISDDSP